MVLVSNSKQNQVKNLCKMNVNVRRNEFALARRETKAGDKIETNARFKEMSFM